MLFGTTQTTTVFLKGSESGSSRKFEITATDAQWNTETTATGTLAIDDVMIGKQITHYMGEYAAGMGISRIRNTVTNKVKGYMVMDVLGEMRYRKLRHPITIEENDRLETYCDVA